MKIYQYGVHDIIAGEWDAIAQMRLRNQLRNALVELDRKNRDAFNTIQNRTNPAHDRLLEIRAEIGELRRTIKLMRKGKRPVVVGPCEEKDRIKILLQQKKEIGIVAQFPT